MESQTIDIGQLRRLRIGCRLLESIEKELAEAQSGYQSLIEKELPSFNRMLVGKGITPIAFVRPAEKESEEDEGG